VTTQIKRVLPQPVLELKVRIDQWRSSEDKKHKMPRVLWEEAAKVAKKYGVHFVASSLALGYRSLKQKVQGDFGPVKSKLCAPANFFEITPPANSRRSMFSSNDVEVHKTDGSWIIIKNADTDCVSQVVKVFLGNLH